MNLLLLNKRPSENKQKQTTATQGVGLLVWNVGTAHRPVGEANTVSVMAETVNSFSVTISEGGGEKRNPTPAGQLSGLERRPATPKLRVRSRVRAHARTNQRCVVSGTTKRGFSLSPPLSKLSQWREKRGSRGGHSLPPVPTRLPAPDFPGEEPAGAKSQRLQVRRRQEPGGQTACC